MWLRAADDPSIHVGDAVVIKLGTEDRTGVVTEIVKGNASVWVGGWNGTAFDVPVGLLKRVTTTPAPA